MRQLLCHPPPPLRLYTFLFKKLLEAVFRAGWGGCLNNLWKLLHSWLGAQPIHFLGCLPRPLPCARCLVVYISSLRHGEHALRDMTPSLILAHGALHQELRVGQEVGPELKQRLKWGLVEGTPGCSSCRPQRVMLCLHILYKDNCPFPFINHTWRGLNQNNQNPDNFTEAIASLKAIFIGPGT